MAAPKRGGRVTPKGTRPNDSKPGAGASAKRTPPPKDLNHLHQRKAAPAPIADQRKGRRGNR